MLFKIFRIIGWIYLMVQKDLKLVKCRGRVHLAVIHTYTILMYLMITI